METWAGVGTDDFQVFADAGQILLAGFKTLDATNLVHGFFVGNVATKPVDGIGRINYHASLAENRYGLV